ncbi:calcitonin gene-related peptide 2-like [Heptranchias perlo]|uniref:calcitonin gene-related peptide 2-like n=1 Tax=Heptranchias perlo TaxID=212740 RepID=UPI00355A18D3
MFLARIPLSMVLLCALAVATTSDLSSLRSPATRHLGKILIRRVDGHYLAGSTQQLQLPNPALSYVQEQERSKRLFPLRVQKRSCNTATCVTHRLANFLSRSGAVGSSRFIPTDVGARAFGRRRREAQM